jgi:hypothetical protein
MVLGGAALFGQSTITCNSNDMRRHYCSVDTRDGVQLVRQRSDAACIEGRTWGYDRRGIWVDRGCRADFVLGRYGYGRSGGYGGYGYPDYGDNRGYSSSLYCASDDMRRNYCSADTRGGVRILRQRSDASCIEGRTWGYDRNGIWVDRGCRADFGVNAGGNRGWGRGGRRSDPYYNDRRW